MWKYVQPCTFHIQLLIKGANMHTGMHIAGMQTQTTSTIVPCSRSLGTRVLPGFSLFFWGGVLPISEKTGTNAPHLYLDQGGGSFPPLSYFALFL